MYSFEFFPPKDLAGEDRLWQALETLALHAPDFVAVTYGAGGGTRDRTIRITSEITARTKIPTVAHLTCVGASKAEIAEVADQYWNAGVRHVVALRGDPTAGIGTKYAPHPGGYAYANDLIAGARKIADFDIGGTTFRKQINRRYPDLEIQHFHHAGNSSGVVDGAAALLIASPEYAAKNGLKPRARIVAYCNQGDDPTLMLNAPVPAAKKVLEKAGLTKDDIDVWEINEAFAVVAEKFIRDLDLDREKVNINGGAMALGHPIGATGSILIGTALDELERTGGRYGLITMCAAGGMAPAIIIERI